MSDLKDETKASKGNWFRFLKKEYKADPPIRKPMLYKFQDPDILNLESECEFDSNFSPPNESENPPMPTPSDNPEDKDKPESSKPPEKQGETSLGKKIAKGALIVGATTTVVSLLPIIAGFGTAGIGAGSIAAGIQSGIGNVASGSLFSIVQSLGAHGVFVYGSAGGAASAGIGATYDKLGAAYNWISRKKEAKPK